MFRENRTVRGDVDTGTMGSTATARDNVRILLALFMAGWFGGVFGDVEDGNNVAVVGTCNSGGQQ